MSGRVRHTLSDGRVVRGYRKTLTRRARRADLPDWRIALLLPTALSFTLRPGYLSGIAGAEATPLGNIVITDKRKKFVLDQVGRVLRRLAPSGLVDPLSAVLERDDEAGPTESGPIRKGEKWSGEVTFDGHEAWFCAGVTRILIATH